MDKSKKDFEENKYIDTSIVLAILMVGVFSFIVLVTMLEDEMRNKTDEESNKIGKIENIKSISGDECVVEVLNRDYSVCDCAGIKSDDVLYKSEKDDCYYVKNKD